MLASTPARPMWTYHQWVCLLLTRTVPPSLCRMSLLGTVSTLSASLLIVNSVDCIYDPSGWFWLQSDDNAPTVLSAVFAVEIECFSKTL